MAANRCYYSLQKQLKSKLIRRNTKVAVYKTLLKPVLTYASETWVLSKSNERLIAAFERKVLRKIFGPVMEHGQWRHRYNHEIYNIYGEPDVITDIKIGRLRWAGHVVRMDDATQPKRLTFSHPQGRRRPGRPRLRWLDGVHKDAVILGLRDWRMRAGNRVEWRRTLDSAKAHTGLSSL